MKTTVKAGCYATCPTVSPPGIRNDLLAISQRRVAGKNRCDRAGCPIESAQYQGSIVRTVPSIFPGCEGSPGRSPGPRSHEPTGHSESRATASVM